MTNTSAQFVDECQLNVRGGDGGAGCVSFRREGPVAMGGPNGGDGGKGGDVWLVADHNVASLLAFRDHPHRRASNGVHGQGKDQHGRGGKDEIVTVPEGTVVQDLYTGEVLAELWNHGDRWLAAAGGRGGRGNAKFLSNKRRAPNFAEQGEHGEERWLKLEIRLMADVALVGFPNVGKSTLISVISAAKPKIADYPFTTLEPNLGVVRVDDDTEFVVADIPGLIEGASEGKGLGHQFLRHVERARVLCLMLDLASRRRRRAPRAGAGAAPGARRSTSPSCSNGRASCSARRPTSCPTSARSSTDQPGRIVVSAVTGDGVRKAVGAMASAVHEARENEERQEGVVLLRPQPTGAKVERVADNEYRVDGRDVERVVALNDVSTYEATAYISHRLERLGVDKLLLARPEPRTATSSGSARSASSIAPD